MLRLVLSRHANAAPNAPGGDKDRPLNTRGMGEAMRMGRYLADQRIRPSIAVVSDARRTRETMDILLRELASHATVHVQPDLYHAEPVDMLAMMRGTPDWVKVLLVIGHLMASLVAASLPVLIGGALYVGSGLLTASHPTGVPV